MLLVVTAANYLSVEMSGAIQVLLTSLKMGTVLVIVVGGLVLGTTTASQAVPLREPLGWGTVGALLTALVPAMWAYNGFNDLGDIGEEILHPQRNIPRAIILGFLTVGALYLAANAVYFVGIVRGQWHVYVVVRGARGDRVDRHGGVHKTRRIRDPLLQLGV